MRRGYRLARFPAILAADDHLIKFTRAPFEVTDPVARAGREAMVRVA